VIYLTVMMMKKKREKRAGKGSGVKGLTTP